MKNILRVVLFALAITEHHPASACGDLDFACKAQEAIDPGCRGDLCKIVKPVDSFAGKTVDNVVKGVQNTPDDIRKCLNDAQKCVINILSTPLAALQLAYFEYLNRQAQGRIKPFSNEFINLAQPYYDIDLKGVTFADDINTIHGMNVALCDRIYFTHSGSIWTDKNELFLTLHELEHLVQCQKRGRQAFLAEYLLKGLVNVQNGTTNTHDNHEFEIAADSKARNLVDNLWNQIVTRRVAVPSSSGGTFPGGQSGGTFPSGIALRFCSTPAGTCGIPPTFAPMGTPCTCATPNGQVVSGAAF